MPRKTGLRAVPVYVGHVAPDAVTVDTLARLQLAARRRERRIMLREPSDELVQLVEFMGLSEVLLDVSDAHERETVL